MVRLLRRVFSVLLLFSATDTFLRCGAESKEGDHPNDGPRVNTTNGEIRGLNLKSATGKGVTVFYGIPYAEPPILNLRFKRPLRKTKWTGVLNATIKPNSCVQYLDETFGNFSGSQMWNANTNMSEDCLMLNVWTPSSFPSTYNLAVLVWIFGGGFYSGTSTLAVYDAETLVAEENVVVVSMNYRVASLGFLYINETHAPGNMGLLDQVMALEWVRDNIAAFGGDPNKVTIFGESAGAVSVNMHMLSPMSKGLFQRAILQSGAATAPWAWHNHSTALEAAKRLAKSLCNSSGALEGVYHCLYCGNAFEMVNNESNNGGVVDFPFVPIVDGIFLVENPQKSLESKNFTDTSILLGSNLHEGSYFILYFLPDMFWKNDSVRITYQNFTSAISSLFPYVNDTVQQAIITKYAGNKEDEKDYTDAVDKVVGDYHFTCPVLDWAEAYAERGSDVYEYFFTQRSQENPWPHWMGVMHGDEIGFVFGAPLNQYFEYPEEEKNLSRRMMKYWANFARNG